MGIFESIAKGVSLPNRQHIFFEHLKELHLQELVSFEDFTESLRTINLSKVRNLISPLRELGINFEDFDKKIYPYLKDIKQDSGNFNKILKQSLND